MNGASKKSGAEPVDLDSNPLAHAMSHRAALDQSIDESRAARDLADEVVGRLRARAACGGYILHLVESPAGLTAFVIHRWCRSREFDSAAAVDKFLDFAGVQRV